MKKLHGLKKRWYMLRDLIGLPSKKYNYKNNYTKGSFQLDPSLEIISFKAHKPDSKITSKMFEVFKTKTYTLYGKERKFLSGVDAAPGVTETTMSILDKIIRELPDHNVNATPRLLSIGCGLRDGLKMFNFIGYDAYGVDFDVPKNSQNKNLKWHNLNDQENLPFEEDFFDIVVCQEVIEHIENPWLLFRKVKRVLKNNGIFILTTPNINCNISRKIYANSLDGWTIHFNPDMIWYHINPLPFFEINHIISYYNFSLTELSGNMEYFIEYKEENNIANIINRNDVLHYVLRKTDNKNDIYIPKPTYK